MNIVIVDECGDVIDTIISSNPFRKASYKRIRNFCFIDSINDYAYVYTHKLHFLMHKKLRRRYIDA